MTVSRCIQQGCHPPFPIITFTSLRNATAIDTDTFRATTCTFAWRHIHHFSPYTSLRIHFGPITNKISNYFNMPFPHSDHQGRLLKIWIKSINQRTTF